MPAEIRSSSRTVISDQYVDRQKLHNLLDSLHGKGDVQPNYETKVSGT